MQAVAEAENVPLAAAAIQFPFREPVVANVLIGTAKPSSLTRNLEILSTKVPESVYTDCERFVLR